MHWEHQTVPAGQMRKGGLNQTALFFYILNAIHCLNSPLLTMLVIQSLDGGRPAEKWTVDTVTGERHVTVTPGNRDNDNILLD